MSTNFLDRFLETDMGIAEVAQREIVVDRRTGLARQAGATLADGNFVQGLRLRAEGSLYVFSKAIIGRDYLTKSLHLPMCDWLQTIPPRRKLALWPREHCKTSIVAHCLPLHILLQPPERNCYFPGEPGENQRITLVGETETRGKDALRVIKAACESNELLRALWPHRLWDNPRQQALKWNDTEVILPRRSEYPDPHIRAIGVGGAVTGSHPSVLIKDDLVTLEAANSPVVMQTAIEWHIASRALINADNALEFIIGTRWAVNDLYAYIQERDPSVETVVRSVVEAGACIYPQKFSLEKVAQLQQEFGVLFPLLYMNSAADPELTDFDMAMLREFDIVEGRIRFTEDDRDLAIAERAGAPHASAATPTGVNLTPDTWQSVYIPGQGFRLRG